MRILRLSWHGRLVVGVGGGQVLLTHAWVTPMRLAHRLMMVWVTNLSWRVCLELAASLVSGSMCTLRVLVPLLLKPRLVDATPVVGRGILIVFLWPHRVELAVARVGSIVQVLVALEWTFAFRTTTHQILLKNVPIFTFAYNLLNIQLIRVLSLLFCDFLRINFGELWEHFDDERTIVLVWGARVVAQP